MQIGEIEVLAVRDGTWMLPASEHYPAGEGKGAGEAEWVAHRQFLDEDGRVELELGGFLVRTGDRLLLVDAGIGPNRQVGGQLLDSLQALGVDPGRDHRRAVHPPALRPCRLVGGGRRRRVSQRDHRCHRLDWEHFFDTREYITKKLRAGRRSRRATRRRRHHRTRRRRRLAAGHTPGSIIVVLSSGAARGLLLGDVVHCPVELLDDEWAGMGDVDPKLALTPPATRWPASSKAPTSLSPPRTSPT